MDKLDIIRKAEKLGGGARRKAFIDLMVQARKLGCDSEIGGGRRGGINIRFGSIGHAILDVATDGSVKLYVDPHPGHRAPDPLWTALNDCIESNPALTPKSFPVRSHGELEDKVEAIPFDQLRSFMTEAVGGIWETYYQPNIVSNLVSAEAVAPA